MSRVISDETWAVLTIWQEARSEPFDGKVAVGRVIRNRMAEHRRGVVDIVLAPYQFSGWNTEDVNRRLSAVVDDTEREWQDCVRAWQDSEHTDAGVGEAYFYYNPAAVVRQPKWADPAKRTAIIGRHQFFLG